MNNPLVSVIIPVFNGDNYLRQAIDSVLAQTYKNIEIIVVNDGSNDGGKTEAICKSYGNKIVYISKKNGGVASAINAGISIMRGVYFSWLSHDDYFECDKIDKQVSAISKRIDKDVVVFSDFMFENTEDGCTSVFELRKYCDQSKIENGIYPILFGLIHFSTVLVSKKRISEVGICDEKLRTTQDMEWLFRLLRGKNNIYLNEVLTRVRLHNMQGKRIIREYSEEQGYLHRGFVDNISPKEVEELFIDYKHFWNEMSSFYRQDNNVVAYNYVKELYNSSRCSDSQLELKNRLIQEIENKKQNGKLIIFCAGEFGKKLLVNLRSRNIVVDNFSDSNNMYWGKSICGVQCISPRAIKPQDLVIIAHHDATELAKDMKHIKKMTFDEVMELLSPILPDRIE